MHKIKMATEEDAKPNVDDEDRYVFVFDRRDKNVPEVRIKLGGIITFEDFKTRVCSECGVKETEKFVIATTNREEIKDDSSWDIVDKGDTLYLLYSLDQELCAPAQERVNYLPHYDTIVKGGMYEYYASEGHNPLPYAFAELIDNALAATANNTGSRNIEIRLHCEESTIYVIDNGKGMTPRQLNNWAIYRLSKFIRKDKRSKVNLDESVEEEQSFISHDQPKSLNSDISYFGVGGKQAVFFIGNATRMISRPRGSKDVHELTISKEEFEKKEKNHESIYSGYIRNRKEGDSSHIDKDEETLRKIIEEEEKDKDSFTIVVIQGISKEHIQYLKERIKEWTTHLAHIYHYYVHGPNGNMEPDDEENQRPASPFQNIDIQVTAWFTKAQTNPRVISLRDVVDDMQTNYVRNSVSSFEFTAHVDGATVEGVLRYHPFLYDRETYPQDIYNKVETTFEDEHDYAISEAPARGRRPIFECFWNGRLIPYTTIESFDWCSTPKKAKNVPVECYNRVSGVLWTDDKFQVSTNKLTFIDLELKLRDKQVIFSRVVNGQEKRTGIEREFVNWLKDCHELHDKQIHFMSYQGQVVRSEQPKNKQTPWAAFKQVDWDGKLFKAGMLVRIQRTLPTLIGTINRILLYGDHSGDVYATGGDLEILQEPKSIYNHEVKVVPLSKLDRFANSIVLKRAIEEEEGKLPNDLIISWPDGNEVANNSKTRAGATIGPIKVEIVNRKGDKISKMPGKDQAQKKLLVELKVIWLSSAGEQTIVSHVCQHGKTWPFWFRKMENIKNLGAYAIQFQVVLNESGENMFAGKPLPCKKIHFQVTEAEPEKFSVGLLSSPFRMGVPFNIPLDLQDGFGNPAKPLNSLSVEIESSGLELKFASSNVKGHKLTVKDVIANGFCPSNLGKNFTITITIPELKEKKQELKIRLLPGPAAALIVTPEEETVLENRKSPEFKVQAVDLAGNNTSLEGKQYVVCTLSGGQKLPSYSTDCSATGSGLLTGEPIILKKMKSDMTLTAKIEVQGSKTIPAVERKIRLVPSGNVTEIQLFYEEEGNDKPIPIKNGEELALKAGESLSTIKIKLFDEAEREIPIDNKMASKIKVNWVAKAPKDLLLTKGVLPPVKSPTSLFEHKYLQVTVDDDARLDAGFVLKSLPGEPFQIRCLCVGGNTFSKGEKLVAEIHIKVKDKFGNDVGYESEKVCKEIQITGDGLIEKNLSVKMDKHKKVIIVKDIIFEDGPVGRKELQITWKQFKDYVRLEMIAGPLKKLGVLNYDPDETTVVYTDSKLPQPFVVQLQDEWGNPVKSADFKIFLLTEKLKLAPPAIYMRTNKEGTADFGIFSVASPPGEYSIKPKVVVGNNQFWLGPEIRISIRADPSRPSSLLLDYNSKAVYVAGETMTEFTVKVFSEDNSLLSTAQASHLSLKLWKGEDNHSTSLPSRAESYSPESTKKSEPGIFLFQDLKNPEETGLYNLMFVYYDGKYQLFSSVIHVKVEPAAPVRLLALDLVETATVSNTRSLNTRCIIKHLRLQLKDKFGNSVTRAMNGSIDIHIEGQKGKELPKFAGGKQSTISLTLAGGMCTITNLALAENSPGSDGCEYHLVCIVSCNNIKATIPPFKIPFLFYNDAKKQSEMAALSKERDNLLGAIKTYKSLFETTEQLIEELKISVREAKAEEQKIKEELRRHKVEPAKVAKMDSINKMLVDLNLQKEELLSRKRRTCSLATVLPNDSEVLGKIGHLALIEDDDAARVLSWHMSSDMDCVVTMTTKKAKEIYQQTNGKQQVLPLDSIFRKTLTDWTKPLPHMKYRPNWKPPGNPMYARNLITFDKNADKCQTVFSMLLGDTLWVDSLDTANDYRRELVKFTNCPTILTREGDRIRSNGKFGGLMNKAPPVEKLKGVVFSSPVPSEVKQYNWIIDSLQNLKAAMGARKTAQEELDDQLAVMNTPEMQTKYDECREVEKQLQELEKKLGVKTPQRSQNLALKRSPDTPDISGNNPKKIKQSPVLRDGSVNGSVASNFNTPTRQSRRLAALSPSNENENRKRLKKT